MKGCADSLADCAKGLREDAAGEIVVPTAAEMARRDDEERAAWKKEYAKDQVGWDNRIPTTAPAPDHLCDEIPF